MTGRLRAMARGEGRSDRRAVVLLAVLAYVPILLTRPGRVSADTKTYLYLDPGDLLSGAASMWDPSVGAGTVPHQNIGYLFPIGPYYWLMESLAVPDWIAQRLLWGTLVFAAAYGAYRLARWLAWAPAPALVVAVAYGLSPYLLSYLARLSAILFPWAALPWMILLAARAARTRSWVPAAGFALVVALSGSVNATALVLAGLGPVIWLVGDATSGRVPVRAALGAALRIGVCTVVVSAWWIIGLMVQGTYGMPILRFTETYDAAASASTPAEVLRSLGYWFFYGGDALDQWVGPSAAYIDQPLLVVLGIGLAVAALLGLLVPFPARRTAVAYVLVGMVIAVGAAPLGDSTLYGTLFESFAGDTTIGLALRSTTRVVPLLALGLAFGLAAACRVAVARLGEVRPRWRWSTVVPTVVLLALAVQLFPWFTGRVLTPSILRDEELPAYEIELADWLDDTGDGRVYELPAADFANYRWGGTVDPVLPGLIDRPYLARELVPQGGDGTADLLNAFERRLSEGWFEPEALAPFAALVDAETIVTRNDLEYERYRLARPGPLWLDVTGALGAPDHAGPEIADEPRIPLVDEITLSRLETPSTFPAVAAFDVAPTARLEALAASPVVVAGSGDGLVDLAAAGLLPTDRPLLYAAALHDRALDDELTDALRASLDDAWWIVTDTNRKQGRRWSTIGSNLGALEGLGELTTRDDPGDNRLELFDDEDLANQTVGVHDGEVAAVRATSYGNLIAYTPEDAPWYALDGDPRTAWRGAVFEGTDGLSWEVELGAPVAADHVTLLQPVNGARQRYITEVEITVDDEVTFVVPLGDASRSEPGQRIDLPVDELTSLRIEVTADNIGRLNDYAAQPGVGFAEVAIPGVTDTYLARVPELGANAALPAEGIVDDRLTFVLTRQRIDPATPNRSAPEPRLQRAFTVDSPRAFSLTGEARLAASAPEERLQTLLGEDVAVAVDRRLPGSVAARGASAFDGDLATAWQTPFDTPGGATLFVDHGGPVSTDRVTVSWLTDDQHSEPTAFTLTADDGTARRLDEPVIVRTEDDITTAEYAVDGFTSAFSTLRIEEIEPRTVAEYFSKAPQILPVGVVDVVIGDAPQVTGPADIPSPCRDDLLTLDGAPIPVRVSGTRESAIAGGELVVEPCGGTLQLEPGRHVLMTRPGADTGIDLDRLVLDSRPEGVDETAVSAPPAEPEITSADATSVTAVLPSSPQAAQWIVLPQSFNQGWRASVDGQDLGAPLLLDGYKNGWIVGPSEEQRTVRITWEPQRSVSLAIWVSAIAGALALALLVVARIRRGPAHRSTPRLGESTRWPSGGAALLAAALAAVVLLIVGGPAAAVAVVAVVAGRRRWPPLAAALVVLGRTVTALGTAAAQWHYDFPPAPRWPSEFAWTAPIVWAMVGAVVGAALPAVEDPAGEPTGPDDEQDLR